MCCVVFCFGSCWLVIAHDSSSLTDPTGPTAYRALLTEGIGVSQGLLQGVESCHQVVTHFQPAATKKKHEHCKLTPEPKESIYNKQTHGG